MGHRLSKTTIADGSNIAANDKKGKRSSTTKNNHSATSLSSSSKKESSNNKNTSSSLNLDASSTGGPRIKVITDSQAAVRLETRSESSSSTNGSRQIIIKILLATMEPGDENDPTSGSSSSTSTSTSSSSSITTTATSQRLDAHATLESNNNLNVERSNLTVNAINFQRNIACDQGSEVKLNNLNGGTSMLLKNNINNNNNNSFVSNFTVEENSDEFRNGQNVQNLNIVVQQMGNSQILNKNVTDTRQSNNNNNNDSSSNRSSMSCSEFSDSNVESFDEECSTKASAITATTCAEDCKSYCCHQKKSSSSSSTSAYHSKWTYCKGTCADVINKLRPSCSKKQNQLPSSTPSQSSESQPRAVALTNSCDLSRTSSNHLQLWSPQIVLVQYPTASQVVALAPIANLDEHAFRLMTGDLAIPRTPESSISMSVSPCSTTSSSTAATSTQAPNGPVVHSQVDFMHSLVPDLDKITKSTYYWGKMDRYEAERLLEGKPEGTFLLRDSAQEEYLFSVTFRKYGRSLHARIEQFNHEFSFDCHDPGVFTAPTVTGLLEHYKDPSIVMFFEPMLTSPLHRTKTFSLQQLCRATIVSRTTYDGISELEIPIRLKSYLKEYHYKQRVRVKPFDESFYNCA